MSDQKLNWRHIHGGYSADVGHVYVAAYKSDDAIVSAGVRVEAHGHTAEEAIERAEATLLKTYEVLRDHCDPLPVLQWTSPFDGVMSGSFVVESNSDPLSSWRLYAREGSFEIRLDDNEDFHPASGKTCSETRLLAEAVLRGLGVRFQSRVV